MAVNVMCGGRLVNGLLQLALRLQRGGVTEFDCLKIGMNAMSDFAPDWKTGKGTLVAHNGQARRVEAADASWSGVDFGRVIGSLAMTSALVCGLYLLKSALGINLMEGHSFLHDPLYHLVG